MKTNAQVNCPSCGSTFKLDDLLIAQFEKSIKADLESELLERQDELNVQRKEYQTLFQQLSRDKESVDELVSSRVKSLLQTKEEALKQSIRKEIDDERGLQLQKLEDELVKKSKQLKELNGTKAELEILRRENEEAEAKIILQKELEYTERLEQARVSIKEQTQQESFLKLKERERVIEDLRLKLDEAKRKAEQYSMQGQGEVLELFLEETLRTTFNTDEIISVEKGQPGADCVQLVKTPTGIQIGSVIWEAKNTKQFSPNWIPKLKYNNLAQKADIMVIVTEAKPNDISGKFGLKDGVWICSKDSVVDLSLALRFGMLKLHSVLIKEQNRESKAQMLYDYLSSESFKNTFEEILSGIKSIQDSHNQEKSKLQALWKRREKMLEQILANAVDYYGTIQGISSAIPPIEMLEFAQAS